MPFIKIKNSYNPLTTQGEGEKLINTNHIVSISKWANHTNKRISTIKARIKLINGEILDVKETIDEVLDKIETSNNT